MNYETTIIIHYAIDSMRIARNAFQLITTANHKNKIVHSSISVIKVFGVNTLAACNRLINVIFII